MNKVTEAYAGENREEVMANLGLISSLRQFQTETLPKSGRQIGSHQRPVTPRIMIACQVGAGQAAPSLS